MSCDMMLIFWVKKIFMVRFITIKKYCLEGLCRALKENGSNANEPLRKVSTLCGLHR